MKLRVIQSIIAITVSTAFLASCGGLGKMDKYKEELGANVEPQPLIVRGDSVEISISGKFPPKYFHKKVSVEATPVLTYEGGESAYETQGYQGEDVAGNYDVIPYEAGKSFSYSDKIAYSDAMEVSELHLNISGTKGSKSATFDPIVLTQGVITTPYLMQNDDRPIMSTDNFERITQHSQNVVINYEYNKSDVRASELKKAEWKATQDFIKGAASNERIALKNSTVDAYASPEGEISLNENLATERAESANAAVKKEIKKHKIAVEDEAAFYVNHPKGEDWDGFKQKMEASNIEDRHLIIRVLEMYPDKNKREQEIRNIAATYKIVEETILPQLRRSQIVINYEHVGYSDEELLALVKSNPDTLNVEEMLYTATLVTDLNEKLAIYRHAESVYGDDYRTSNNIGYILFLLNKKDEAKAQFEKAYAINQAPEVANNMGICARLDGDRDAAMSHFANAGAAGNDVKYNKGLVQIQNGDYASAVSNMGQEGTFNTALVNCLNGSQTEAQAALDKSGDDSAMAHYLSAIIAARADKNADAISHLTKAVQMDASLKEKAMKDLEFRNIKDQMNF